MKRFALHAVALLTLAACQDRTVAPTVDRPSFSTIPSIACPASPTFVVSDEASLRAALAAASPGAVIAIRGMIGIAADVFITTPNVTLTCASAGAGLFSLSTLLDALVLVDVGGSGVVVDGLVLDASAVSASGIGVAYFAGDVFGPGLPVPNVRFTHNTVTCSPGGCTLLAGTSGAVISNNTFTSAGSLTGVHVQLGIDNLDSVRIEGNTIVTTGPSDFRFGGIRVVGARHVVIRDNTVTGPWANSLSLATLSTSTITSNQLSGAAIYGIGLTRNPRLTTFVLSSTFSSNVVTGAASGGIFARKACGNVFVGNNLQGNGSNIGLIFPDTSGANIVVGNPNVVVDNGAYDCNGDGVNDPNIITGAGAVMRGVNLGQVVSDAVVSSNRLQ
jgi:copper-binding protein NosD